MKRTFSITTILILLGLLIVITITSFDPPQATQEAEHQEITQKDFPLQDFELVNLDDQSVQLSDFREKVVILNFWATWCPPCRQEMPLLVEIHNKYQPNVIVLGVNSMETSNEVRTFVEGNKLSFPVVLDSDGSVGQQYLVNGLPTTLFIDKKGVLKIRHVGALNNQILDEYLLELGVYE